MAQPVNTDDHTIRVIVSTQTPEVEYYATEVIKPGMLCELTPGSALYVPTHVRRHSEDLGTATPMFAVEETLSGRTIDTSYNLGQRVHLLNGRAGDVVLVWIVGGGSTVINLEIGMYLVSYWHAADQGGHLQPVGIQEAQLEKQSIVAQSLQIATLTSVPQRILARII